MRPLRQLVKTTLEAMLPHRVFLCRGRRCYRQGDPSHVSPCAVSLTFDDGPHPDFTPQVLDNLATAHMRAAFFIVGEKAERYPDLVRRMAAEGHEIGNHTWTHSEPRCTSTKQFRDEILRTGDLINKLSGRECTLVRPPKGELSPGKLVALLCLRQTVVLWNQDPRDYRMQSENEMEDWCREFEPRHGDIVLLHDNHPYAATAAALVTELPQFSATQFCTVSEWLWPASPSSLLTGSAGAAHESLTTT